MAALMTVVLILAIILVVIEIGAVLIVRKLYNIENILGINVSKYNSAVADRDTYRNKMACWARFAMGTWDYEFMARTVAAESKKGIPKEEVASVILNRLRALPIGEQHIADVLIEGHFMSVNDGEAYAEEPGPADYSAVQRSVLRDYAEGRTDLDHEVYF